MAGTAVQFFDMTQAVIYATLSARFEGWLLKLGCTTAFLHPLHSHANVDTYEKNYLCKSVIFQTGTHMYMWPAHFHCVIFIVTSSMDRTRHDITALIICPLNPCLSIQIIYKFPIKTCIYFIYFLSSISDKLKENIK